MVSEVEAVTIEVGGSVGVSALFQHAERARAVFVLAHGAGAGMRHPFMTAVANELAGLGIATLRYQFPYMERQTKRPDPPSVCHATIRAAVEVAHRLAPRMPLIAGGKSFGGRMTSQAQSADPLPNVRGLAFLGFPLHPPKKPADGRAEHLLSIGIPMLFLQGTRDQLADGALISAVADRLGERATLKLIEGADHSFHVPARTGRTDPEVRAEMLAALAAWSDAITGEASLATRSLSQ